MARGDFIDVIYKLGTGSGKERMQATSVGSFVRTTPGRDNLIVEVLDKNHNPTRTGTFRTSELIAFIEGHEKVK